MKVSMGNSPMAFCHCHVPFQRGGLRPLRTAGRQVGREVLRGHVGELEEDLAHEEAMVGLMDTY